MNEEVGVIKHALPLELPPEVERALENMRVTVETHLLAREGGGREDVQILHDYINAQAEEMERRRQRRMNDDFSHYVAQAKSVKLKPGNVNTLYVALDNMEAAYRDCETQCDRYKAIAEWLAEKVFECVEEESLTPLGISARLLYWQEYEDDGNTETPASLRRGRELRDMVLKAAEEVAVRSED